MPPAWRQSKDDDVDGLKDTVTKLLAFMKRLDERLPPPLISHQECQEKLAERPSEVRGLYDDVEEHFLRSHLEAPAVNAVELQGLLFTVAFGDEAEALMMISSADAMGKPTEVQLDVKDSNGRTALHCAASRGSAAITRMLLDHSNFVHYINSPDRYLRTALHMAARAGHADVCRLLLNHRLFNSPSAADCDGQTALHHAAAAGQDEVCAALMEHSDFSGLEVVDCFGRTALHYAARGGHEEVAEILLKDAQMSTVWLMDCDHLSPLHCAAFRGHNGFCEKIVAHSSFKEACDAGVLKVASLRHARDEVRTTLQQALEAIGLSLPPLNEHGCQDEPDALQGGSEAECQEHSPGLEPAEERVEGFPGLGAKSMFGGSPLVAIDQQLQAVKVKPMDYFAQLDRDGDGRLTDEELRKCLLSVGYKVSAKELEDLLTRLDAERAGTVDIVVLDRAVKLDGAEFEAKRRQELERAMRRAAGLEGDADAEPTHPAIMALLQKLKDVRIFELFRTFDRDGDGFWSPSELRNALHSTGHEVNTEDVNAVMELMDSNHNGFIDVKELARALHRAKSRANQNSPGSEETSELDFTNTLQEIAATAALVAIYERLEHNKLRTTDFLQLFNRSSEEYLMPAELQTGLQQIGYEISQQELNALLFVLDVDRLGMLNIKEFERRVKSAAREALEAAALRLAQDSPTDTSVVDILTKVNAALHSGKLTVYGRKIYDAHGFFKAIDKDGSGSLDPPELQRGFRRLGVELSDQLLLQLSEAIDTNENGKIELDEFIRALHNPKSMQKRPSVTKAPGAASRSRSSSQRPSGGRLSIPATPKEAEHPSSQRSRSPFGPVSSRRQSLEDAGPQRSSIAEGRARTSQRSSSPRIVQTTRGSLSNSPRPRTSLKETADKKDERKDDGGEKAVDAMGALRLIYEHMEKKRLRTIDLFRRFDQSDDGSITRSELRKGLEEIGVEIDPASFKSLVGHLDRDSGGTINLKELDRGIKEAVREKVKDTRIDPERFVEYALLKEINQRLFSGTQMVFGNRVTDSRSFFRAIDKDNSGELDAMELAQGLLKLGISVESEDMMKEVVSCIDKNASGLIDKEEFVKALQNPEELLASPEAKPKERPVVQPGSEEDATKALAAIHEQLSTSKTRTTDWFYRMDTSRDGKISRAELKKGLKEMGCNLNASDLKAVLLYLDKDDSGSISLQELQKGMNRAVRAVAEAASKLEPVVEGPAKNVYEALLLINAALRSNTQLIFGLRVTDGRSFFKAMDRDSSGTLDPPEVARGFKRLGVEVSETLLDEIVVAVDVNKNGMIEMSELLHALKLPQDIAAETPPPEAEADKEKEAFGEAPGESSGEPPGKAPEEKATEPEAAAEEMDSPDVLMTAKAVASPSPSRRASAQSEKISTIPEEGEHQPVDPVEPVEEPEKFTEKPRVSGSSIKSGKVDMAQQVRQSTTATRKSQATGRGGSPSQGAGNPFKRASRAAGSSAPAARRGTQLNTRATLNRGSPSPRPSRATTMGRTTVTNR